MTGKSLLRQLTSIVLTLALAVPLFTSCSKEEKEVVSPDLDVTPPVISVKMSEVDISGGKVLRIDDSQLLIGEDVVATWSDDKTESCTVTVHAAGTTVQSGALLQNAGTLTLNVVDKGGNSTDASVTLKVRSEYGQASIRVQMSEVNVFGGAEVKIEDNTLFICTDTVASWTPNDVPVKTVTLTFNGTAITSGSMLDQAGTLIMTVISEAGKSSQATINIKDEALYGVEKLKQATMKVDNEINLLEGITFADGVELVKVEVEIDGQRMSIPEPYHFSPEYPGVCNVIFTVKGKSGNSAEINVDNLTIKPLDYKEATINTANMIQDKYPRYNNLQQTTKDFIYPHLIASYAACNRSKQDNRVHIIMGETTDASDVENIGQYENRSDHAYQGYYRIRALSPNTTIKGFSDFRFNLEEYIKQHPDKIYIISQAAGSLGGTSREGFNNNPEIAPQKALLENENVIIIGSGGNWGPSGRKVYNENTKNGDDYNRSSTNSKKNNKITVTGYNSWGGDNYFSPRYSVYGGLRSAMPIGYDKDKGNIVMPMIPLISSHNNEDQNTTSSYPTAVTSGVIGNAISVIMSNHPGITAEDAMTIIVNNYLIQEKFQYKDETTNRELVDGDYRYFIDIQPLLDNELLQKDKFNAILFNADEVALPSGNGICYVGKGIQLEYDGQKYDITDNNQAVILKALKSGNAKWYWNRDRFLKYGGAATVTFAVYITDINGNKIPNLTLTVKRNVQ